MAGLGLGMDGLPAPTPDFEDEPVLIAANIDSVGSFRIDDLESGIPSFNPFVIVIVSISFLVI